MPVSSSRGLQRETVVTAATVGVEDPEVCAPPRWAMWFRATITSVRWPTTSRPSRIHDRRASSSRMPVPSPTAPARPPVGPGGRWLEHDPGCSRAPRERSHPAQSIGDSRRRPPVPAAPRSRAGSAPLEPRPEVDDQQVHRPALEQRAGDGEALLGVRGGQDDQPLGLHAARNGLDGIERGGEVQLGDDRAGGLRLRRQSQRQRRPAAGGVAPHRHAHAPRHAAGSEDRIELREPGRQDARVVRGGSARAARPPRGPRAAPAPAPRRPAGPLAGIPGRGRAPARPEGREGRVQCARGGMASIEQMFE